MQPAFDNLYKRLYKKFMVFMAVIIGCIGLQAVTFHKKAEPRNSRSTCEKEKGLKDYYKNYFPIGVAVTRRQLKDPKRS